MFRLMRAPNDRIYSVDDWWRHCCNISLLYDRLPIFFRRTRHKNEGECSLVHSQRLQTTRRWVYWFLLSLLSQNWKRLGCCGRHSSITPKRRSFFLYLLFLILLYLLMLRLCNFGIRERNVSVWYYSYTYIIYVYVCLYFLNSSSCVQSNDINVMSNIPIPVYVCVYMYVCLCAYACVY